MKKRRNSIRVISHSLLLLCTSLLIGSSSLTDVRTVPPPDVVCPAATGQVLKTKRLQRISGTLELGGPTINLLDYSCFSSGLPLGEGEHEFDVISFTPSVAGVYTFFLGADFAGNFSLYQGDFNAENPCSLLMRSAEQSYMLPLPAVLPLAEAYLSFDLRANETYSLLISNELVGGVGDWEVMAYHETAGTLSGFADPVPHPLLFDLLLTDTSEVFFATPQQWIVDEDGSLDTMATLTTFFAGDEAQLDAFLAQLNATGMPVVTGDCGPMMVRLSDELSQGAACEGLTLTRTFEVETVDENCTPAMASCQQVIAFRLPTLADIQWPAYAAKVQCEEGFSTDGEVGGPDDNPSVAAVGRPLLLTAAGYVNLDSSYQNLSVSYVDEFRIVVCEGSYKYRRQWSLEDACTTEGSLMIPQLVTVADEVGPVFVNLQDTIRISTSPFSCLANFAVPTPAVVDGNGCSSASLTVYTILAGGTAFFAGGNFGDGDVVQLPIGVHLLISFAEDDCGNETAGETVLIVTDDTPPTANCVFNFPTILIGGGDVQNGIEGIARRFPEDFNDGSNDNCGEVSLEVRRNYWRNNTCDFSANRWSPWGPHVDFYCCDVAKNGLIVELRVTDEAGVQATCAVMVEVDDTLAPFCFTPGPESISCGEPPAGFPADIEGAYANDFRATSILMNSLFGGATGTDNCAVDTLVEIQPLFQLNDCGWGTITRRFEAWQLRPAGDANGNWAIDINEVYRSTNNCTQVITVAEAHDFMIDFPQDVTVDCGETDYPGVAISTTGCDILAINTGDPVPFPVSGEECNLVSITYDVINWCVWDGVSEGWEIPRLTEDDGEMFGTDFGVEAAERPVLRITSAVGPDDENCDGILSTAENGTDDAQDIRYFLLLDRNHPDVDGDSSLPDAEYDNVAETPAGCVPADGGGLRTYGRFRYTQLVKVFGVDSIGINVLAFGGPTANCPNLLPGQFGDDGDCEEGVSISFSVGAGCGLFADELNTSVSIVSAQLDAFAVDVNGDNTIQPDEFIAETGEAGNVIANITSNNDGTYTFAGIYPIITSAMGDSIYHAVSIVVEDACGNQSSKVITFDVIDCKAPAPICNNGLTYIIEPLGDGTCGAIVQASDFIGAPGYDCNGQGPEVDTQTGLPMITSFAVYLASEVDADPDFQPDATQTSITVTEDGEATIVVYIYAFDEEGNYDYCETYLTLAMSTECTLDLAGVILTKDDETIEGVEVYLSGSANLVDETSADGYYHFGDLDFGGSFSLIPYLNTDPANGVNTIDMILLLKHINGTAPLQNPFLLIAADVDGSGDITMADFDLLRQLLLGNIEEFPNNTSWRFVVADFVFPNPLDPWATPFPEIVSLVNVQEDMLEIDFVGVKIGDLNGTAMANFQSPPQSYLRETVYLEVEDMELEEGKTYTIPITSNDLGELDGLQGTFQWDDLEVVDIHYDLAPAFGQDHLGVRHLGEGYLTMAWVKPAEMGTKEASETPTSLFSLVVRAKRKAKLSELLRINSRYTAAEAYRDGNTMDVSITFNGGDVAVQRLYELYQNTPNPFTAATLIGFDLPEREAGLPGDASATLTINDASGRVLAIIKGDYAAGYNSINVTKQMLQGATGVLSYTLETGDHRTTKQMIVVE